MAKITKMIVWDKLWCHRKIDNEAQRKMVVRRLLTCVNARSLLGSYYAIQLCVCCGWRLRIWFFCFSGWGIYVFKLVTCHFVCGQQQQQQQRRAMPYCHFECVCLRWSFVMNYYIISPVSSVQSGENFMRPLAATILARLFRWKWPCSFATWFDF